MHKQSPSEIDADKSPKSVYADMDTECLRDYSSLFAQHNISLRRSSDLTNDPNAEDTNQASPSTVPSPIVTPRTAFLARMGTDASKKHSIPNT